MTKKYKTSEWVSLGHPDKIADYISEYILDRIISKDPDVRYAIECQIKDNQVTLAGELTTKFKIKMEKVRRWVKEAVNEIGYTKSYQDRFGKKNAICGEDIIVTSHISCQSPDIAQGVNKDAWGDQGIFFGYFCDETEEGHGIEYKKAKEVGKALYDAAKEMKYPIGLDIKTQATICIDEFGEYEVKQFIVAVPVIEGTVSQKDLEKYVRAVLNGVWPESKGCKLIVNGTGSYTIHGPIGDSGTTGRKLAVDFYGSRSRIGGGCVDGVTEYMSENGWKRIDKYDGGLVGQLNENLELEMVKPKKYIDIFHEDVYEISTEKTTSMVLSGNHNVLYRTSKGHLQKKHLSKILEETSKTKKGSHIDIPMTFTYKFNDGEKRYTDTLSRILIAHCADGTNTNDCVRYNCRMRLKKQYKIERMRDLLNKSGIYHEERKYSDGFTYFYYMLENNNKLLSEQFKNPTEEEAQIICEEVFKWDGSEKYREFNTTKKCDADFVQFILSAKTGKAYSIITRDKTEKGHSELYTVRETQKKYSNPFRKIGKNKIVQLEPQNMYCFTVPSGMLLLRRKNYIFCTGNSPWTKDGSKADLTLNMYAYDLARDVFGMLKESYSIEVAKVETEISCCIGQRDVIIYATAYDKNDVLVWSESDKIKIRPSKLIKKYKLDNPVFAKLCKDGLFTTI